MGMGLIAQCKYTFHPLNELNAAFLNFAYIYSSTSPIPFSQLTNQISSSLAVSYTKPSTMKYSVFALTVVLALATSAFAAPPAEVADGGDVQIQETCYHASSCSTHWSGLCEDYCGHRGFSHMTGSGCSGWFSKKCCCNRN